MKLLLRTIKRFWKVNHPFERGPGCDRTSRGSTQEALPAEIVLCQGKEEWQEKSSPFLGEDLEEAGGRRVPGEVLKRSAGEVRGKARVGLAGSKKKSP